jgi:peptide/nickel transport system substrate-binding protein
MRLTIELAADAVWDDGSPITVADFQCTHRATMTTPGAWNTVGYEQISSIAQGSDEREVVIELTSTYAPYRSLFDGILKAAAFADCDDVSAELAVDLPFSGGEWKLESWSPTQAVLVPNERYFGPVTSNFDEVLLVPLPDVETQISAIRAGEVDFVFPLPFADVDEAFAGPDTAVSVQPGYDIEALYFQQDVGPFADDVYREAFSMSIDREELVQQVYGPISASATDRLDCGPVVPGRYCDDVFAASYQPTAAVESLDRAGWTRPAGGMWTSPDGEVPRVRWMTTTASTRESAQAHLIPLLREAGFDVVANNCDSACVLQQRLPAMDYELTLFTSILTPDPGHLTANFACDQIPSAANGFAGANTQGWCDEEASRLLHAADVTLDEQRRTELVKQVIQMMADEAVMLPLYQLPRVGAYRTDAIGGPVTDRFDNYMAFSNFGQWDDVDGDRHLVIGVEEWPTCLNPVTECGSAVWYQWTIAGPVLPRVWEVTDEGGYVTSALVAGEPTVEVL